MANNNYSLNIIEEKEIWNLQFKMAEHLIKSGALPSSFIRPEQALAVIQYGRELGYKPMTALQNINIIKGKASMSANLMAARFKDAGNDFSVDEWDNKICKITFIAKGSKRKQTFEYTIEDAKLADFLGKDNWKKNPKEMLYARCISKGTKIVDPTIMMGLYTPEELGANIDDDGNIIQDMSTINIKPEKEENFSEPNKEHIEEAATKEIPKVSMDDEDIRIAIDEWQHIETTEEALKAKETYKQYEGIKIYEEVVDEARKRIAKKTPKKKVVIDNTELVDNMINNQPSDKEILYSKLEEELHSIINAAQIPIHKTNYKYKDLRSEERFKQMFDKIEAKFKEIGNRIPEKGDAEKGKMS